MYSSKLNLHSPAAIMEWLNQNIEYEGKTKGYLRTPSQLVEDQKGHCWETVDFERTVLLELGFGVLTFYLEDGTCKTTHTTLVYRAKNKFYWFEWAWAKYEGIHEFDSLHDAVDSIRNYFLEEHGSLVEFRVNSRAVTHQNDTELMRVTRMRQWPNAEYGQSIDGFSTVRTTKKNVDFFKRWYPNLSHVRVASDTEGILIIDFKASKVIGVLQCRPQIQYIIALEIAPSHRNQGLAEKLLSLAMKDYGCYKLSVNKRKTDVIRLYQKYGWQIESDDEAMLYMRHGGVMKKNQITPVYRRW